MYHLTIVALLSLTICLHLTASEKMTADLYVFAYSWTPEYCYGQPSFEGCKTPQEYWGKHFTLHGLWPQYSTGGYPASCSVEKFNTSIPLTVGWDEMIQYWPNVKYLETSTEYTQFWEHEWSKHGTCTDLPQFDYFAKTLSLIKSFGTPASVTNAVGSTMSASVLRDDFGGSSKVALQCNGGTYLSGAFTCWTQSNGFPIAQTTCPDDVIKEDSCRSEMITIQSF